jgi:hypothetical protein
MQMKSGCAVALSFFLAVPALADDASQPVTANGVTFTCTLEGGGSTGHDGYKIVYTSAVERLINCAVICEVTKSDNNTYWRIFFHPAQKGPTADTNQYFDGEAGVEGAPLSNPKITVASCN